jgi:hypothetical protein
MADIKQAAKWIQDGKHVQRKGWIAEYATRNHTFLICWINDYRVEAADHAPFSVYDLLADDWEIADGGRI